jgi:hypothetical protein
MVRLYTVPSLVAVIVTMGGSMLVVMAMNESLASGSSMGMFQNDMTLVVNGGTIIVIVVSDVVPWTTDDK